MTDTSREDLIVTLRGIVRGGVADYFNVGQPNGEAICKAADMLEADTNRITELEALSVTNIMLDVVPGDGSGLEIFAKSTSDVEDLLTKMSEKIENFESPKWAQQVAVPLSEDQINKIVREAAKGSAIRRDGSTAHRIARAVEAHHKIKPPQGDKP